jgi:hypothetical protein
VYVTCYLDADGDYYGATGQSESVETCSTNYYESSYFTGGGGSVTGDCNDNNALINPGATDSCPIDGVDNDCSNWPTGDYTNCPIRTPIAAGTMPIGAGTTPITVQ